MSDANSANLSMEYEQLGENDELLGNNLENANIPNQCFNHGGVEIEELCHEKLKSFNQTVMEEINQADIEEENGPRVELGCNFDLNIPHGPISGPDFVGYRSRSSGPSP